MSILESLEPRENQRVIDLVESAGVDISPWSETRGHVASNPKFCYEWAFVQPGQVIVVNLWHEALKERKGQVWCDLNLREWYEKGRQAETLSAGERSSLAKRALRMDNALMQAFEEHVPLRVIIGQGSRRDIFDSESKTASRMKLRLLDPQPWSVKSYDLDTGKCRVIRGNGYRFVDQFSAPLPQSPQGHEVTVNAWERSRKVRDAALQRSEGKCELCGKQGFLMASGEVYLETHHVIPLSENGLDTESNVVAICPNDHREAHYGERRDAIRSRLLAMLAEIYGR